MVFTKHLKLGILLILTGVFLAVFSFYVVLQRFNEYKDYNHRVSNYDPNAKSKTFHNEIFQYEIQFPEDWMLERAVDSTFVSLISPVGLIFDDVGTPVAIIQLKTGKFEDQDDWEGRCLTLLNPSDDIPDLSDYYMRFHRRRYGQAFGHLLCVRFDTPRGEYTFVGMWDDKYDEDNYHKNTIEAVIKSFKLL